MDYPNAIKALRKSLLLTQEELATNLGVAFATVNRWENGQHEPTMKMKRKLATYFKKAKIKID